MSADPAAAEARLQRLEARAELSDLVARYGMAVDDRDLDAVVDLFTPDGSFGHENAGSAVGHEAIRAHYLERLSGIPYSVHYPHSQLLTALEDDTAAGIVTAHAEMGRTGHSPLRAAMRYHDSYRRHEGHWRFARRRVRFWYFAPVDLIDQGALGAQRVRWPGIPRPADLPETAPAFDGFQAELAARAHA